MIRKALFAVIIAGAAVAGFSAPALAQTTPFLTERGTVNFPFLPPATAGGPYRLNNVTVNATTPQAGAFTTLSATGAVSGAGFTARFATPGPIGSGTPSTGAFTTLSASGAVSGAGFSALLASPSAIGGTAPAAGTFTTLRATTAPIIVPQGAPAAKTVSATLTAAEVLTTIITVNQGAAGASAQQLPLATDLDTALPTSVAGDAFDFSVINISAVAAEAASITTNSGWTLVGDMDVAANSAATTKSAGRFRARKTGTGTWVLYRLS